MRKTIPISIRNLKGEEVTENMVIEIYPQQINAYKASAFLERMPLGIVEIFKDINDFDARIKAFEERAHVEATGVMTGIHITSPFAIFKKHGYDEKNH